MYLFLKKKDLKIIMATGVFICLSLSIFSQSANTGLPDSSKTSHPNETGSDVNSPADVKADAKKGAMDTSAQASDGKQNPAEIKNPVIAVPRVFTNPVLQNRVNDQLHWTPEDPSFLYETRNIPDHKKDQEYLSPSLEKVVVKEQIKEDMDFRKSLGKIKIRLPDLTQTLVLACIIIIILVYRARARRSPDSRK